MKLSKVIFIFLFLFILFVPTSVHAFDFRRTGSVNGFVYLDKNNNSVRDNWWIEYGLANWQVFIDANNNSQYDLGERTTTTNKGYFTPGLIDGFYFLGFLETGETRVCETQQTGFLSTFNLNTTCQDVLVKSRRLSSGVNFGNIENVAAEMAKLTIKKYTDPENDPFLFNFSIYQDENSIENFTVSALDGDYETYLSPGEYGIFENLTNEESRIWTGAQEAVCVYNNDPNHTSIVEEVSLLANDDVVCSFYSLRYNSIGALIYQDLNLNGIKDEGEGLENWQVDLYPEPNCPENRAMQNAITNNEGIAILGGIGPGSYSVYQTTLVDGAHDDWQNITGGQCQNVELETAGLSKDIFFVNAQNVE